MAGIARPFILFPGSGILFWWQAGAASALTRRFDLSGAGFAGTSGGALAAVLAACGCDAKSAFNSAQRLCREAGAFERGPWGLYAIWGGLVRAWLAEILPKDAASRCAGRVHIVVRRPLGSPYTVNDFQSRIDLIDACLASAHIPFLMDGSLLAAFRGAHHVDSDAVPFSKQAVSRTLESPAEQKPRIIVDPRDDPRVRTRYTSFFSSLQLSSPDRIGELMGWGEMHIHSLDANKHIQVLDTVRLPGETLPLGVSPMEHAVRLSAGL